MATTEQQQQTAEIVKQTLAAVQAASTPAVTPGTPAPLGGGFGGAPTATMGMQFGAGVAGPTPQPTGVSIRVSIPIGNGAEVPGYVHFGPEVIPNVSTIVQQLLQAGWPIRVYEPRSPSWGGGGGGFNGGGRRGYGYRRY